MVTGKYVMHPPMSWPNQKHNPLHKSHKHNCQHYGYTECVWPSETSASLFILSKYEMICNSVSNILLPIGAPSQLNKLFFTFLSIRKNQGVFELQDHPRLYYNT